MSSNSLNDLSKVYLDRVATLNTDLNDKDVKRWEDLGGPTPGNYKPEGDSAKIRAEGAKLRVKNKESLSDWRSEGFFEAITTPTTDVKALRKISEKPGINNKVEINPKLKEAVAEMGGELLEVTDEEIEEETACMRLAILLQTCLQNRDSPAFALVHDKIGGEENRLTTHLLDPGVVSGDLLDMCSGAIMMSGTLTPPEMYRDILKIPLDRQSNSKEYTSHFLSERRPVLIAKDVTSRYQDRGEENTSRLRAHIHSILNLPSKHL